MCLENVIDSYKFTELQVETDGWKLLEMDRYRNRQK